MARAAHQRSATREEGKRSCRYAVTSETVAAMQKADGEILAAANDNDALTVAGIVRQDRAARVYNFEVESRTGEITNNYFVGDADAWVHNAFVPKGGRDNFFKRKGKICTYCGNPATSIDHIIPRCKGGSNDFDNLNPACGSCNSSKGGKWPWAWPGRKK